MELSSALRPEEVPEFTGHVGGGSALEEEAREQQEGLSALVGLVCLTERHLDRLMWAHYAESHKGFVAEFRCTEHRGPEQTPPRSASCLTPFGGAMKVGYLPHQPLRKRDGSNIGEVCWSKHEVWEYEQEWRVVESLTKADPHPTRAGYFLLWFKPADLLRLILGRRVDPEVRFRLRQMLYHEEFGHVTKEEAYIDQDTRELRSRPLPW
jgi:hypothetical protein